MARFDSTQWSVVLRAGGNSADARGALNALCRTYRPPVLGYVQSRGYASDVAEDLTQAFFAEFIECAWHASADPTRGRFRTFLLVALKRFLSNAQAHARTLKLGGGVQTMTFSQSGEDSANLVAEDETPERTFERHWALTVLDGAMRTLRNEADAAGKSALFGQLREFLAEAPDEADYERAAQALGLRRNTVAVAVHRLRHRLRELVRAELLQTTTSRAGLEAELRDLRSTLARVID